MVFCAIFTVVKEASQLGFTVKVKNIIPVTTEEFSLLAKSSHFSVLSEKKILPLFSDPISLWRESFVKMLKEFKE